MSRYFLTGITVEGFRGINNENQPLRLKFKPEAVNSVFAANATGKSSIFEALCFAIRGHIPKLRALQVAEHPEKYISNLFHSKGTATVELELEDDLGQKSIIQVLRSAGGLRTVSSPSGLPNPEAVLKSLDEDFTLLDYEQFTDFINRTPLERGRSFAALLGLSGYSQLRQLVQSLSDLRNINADFDLPSLRASTKTNESHAKESFARFAGAYTSLTGLTPGDVSDVAKWGADIRDALLGIELFRVEIEPKKLSELDFQRLRELVQSEEGGAKRDEFAKIVEKISTLAAIDVEPVAAVADDAEVLSAAIATKATLLTATPGADYLKIHEAALRLYASDEWHEPKQCALCKSNLPAPLLPEIKEEVARFEAVRSQEQVIRDMASGAAWLACLRRLEGVPDLGVADADKLSGEIVEGAQRGTLARETVDQAVALLIGLAGRLSECIDGLKARRAALEKELPPSLVAVTTQIEHAFVAQEALSAYWRASNAVTRLRSQITRYERWQKYILTVTDELCMAETKFAAARLDALGSDYKDLFTKVMGVSDVVPVLSRSEQNEQLEVRLEDFHGLKDLSARALLSESYRNALAVSVFLSAAAQQTTAARFVVLDDVTSSFDAGHQFRLMDEIRTQLQHRPGRDGLQFILLSHDGLLEKYFDKVSGGTDWHHQRLQGWPPLGAVSTVAQDANRLRTTAANFLASGQVKEAEPLIRQYLEFVLLKIIRKVNIPVPYDFAIREQLQMIGNCLDAITAAVKLQSAAGGLVMEQGQVDDLERRHAPALIANWVNHYATAVSANLSPAVLLGVLQSADDLADLFKCDDTTVTPPTRRWYRSLTSL